MEPINPIDTNQVRIIGNNPINVPNSNINRISGPSVIPTVDKPILQQINAPVVRGLEVPVIDTPNTTIQYPVVRIPTQAEFDSAIKPQQKQQEQQPPEKSRGLPDPTPAPQLPATAGAVAVVTTASTMIATQVLNLVKNAAEPVIREATKNKFKIKIKQTKPVLHYVMAEEGHIDIFEYSAEGTRLVAQTDNVEQYIRDQVETNAYYEMDNKIIIDDVMSDKFTKEGRERFKSLFTPPKKIAKKLSARLSF